MKSLKQIVATSVLTLALTSIAFAGDTPCGVLSTPPTGKHLTASAPSSTLNSLTNAVYNYLGYVLLVF
ncbi:MAG TPA: hypothetical protein VM870_07955 [Pyrinomonadaceae bacterium]|nr:hypothetical protein [Pyrinomonadaceae bacterium]